MAIKDENQSKKLKELFEARHHFIVLTLALLKHTDISKRFLKAKQLSSLTNVSKDLENTINGPIFYRAKNVQSNSSNDKTKLHLYRSSGLADDPLNQRNSSVNFISDMKNKLNMLYNVLNKAQQENLRAYMITTSYENIDYGYLRRYFRGYNSDKSNHRLRSIKTMGSSFINYLDKHFHILGGISSYEVTVNKEKLLKCDGEGIYNGHLHLIVLTDEAINISHPSLRNGKCLNTNRTILKGWRNQCNSFNKYLRKKHMKPKKFNNQALDIREAYAGKSGSSLGDALSEEIKYPAKPQYLSAMKNLVDGSNDVDINDENSRFQLNVFAELKGALYRNPAHNTFGLLRKIGTAYNKLGKLRKAVIRAMDSNPKFNVSSRRTFGDVYTKKGILIHVPSSSKEGSHWKAVRWEDMTDKEMLFNNSSLISNILLDSKQFGFIKKVIDTFDYSKLGDVKKDYFDSLLSLFKKLTYTQSVQSLIDDIKYHSHNEWEKAVHVAGKSHSKFKSYIGKSNDLNRFANAIDKYSDDDGIIRLGLHTSPDFKFNVENWNNVFKSSIDSKSTISWKRAWKFYAAESNGYKDVFDTFSSFERSEIRESMSLADSIFGYGEIAPRPREVVSLDHPYCYWNVYADELGNKDSNYITNDDCGDLITIKDYDKLTAPNYDTKCYSKSGCGFDINLFADVNKFSDVASIFRNMMSPFIKKQVKSSNG